MPDWVPKANIEHFKKLLETEKDPRKRAVIEKELAEEEAKLAALLKDRNEKEPQPPVRRLDPNALLGSRSYPAIQDTSARKDKRVKAVPFDDG